MQSTKEMAIGIQLDAEQAMITVYTPDLRAPQTLQVKPEGSDGDIYCLDMPEDVWKAARGLGQPIEKIRDYLDQCLNMAAPDAARDDLHVMVTVPKLDSLLGERLPAALEMLGLKRRSIYIQDFLSSFFYYTINEKQVRRGSDTALFEYEDETMLGYILHVDYTKSPALCTVKCQARQSVTQRQRDGREDKDWDKERDRLLFELAKKAFEGRSVSTVFLMGDYFNREWAPKSYQYLCGGRHAFQGRNLYAKGACYGAMERCGMLKMPDILFMGEDVIQENLGLYLRIRGRQTYYPLVSAGVNWYEAHHECEFMIEDEKSIDIVGKSMLGGEEIHHLLRLAQLPDRPPRTTRLKLVLYFTSPSQCALEIEDVGFGVMQRSSGMIWKRTIHL